MKRELGSFERALVISNEYAPFHIVSVIHLENAPPPQVLKQALKIVQNRHPFLRSRLLKERGKYYFENLTDPDLLFHFLSRWNAEHWFAITEAELTNRIDVSTGALFRCTYLSQAAGGQGDIILSFFHPIVDASSVSQLLHQLLTACVSVLNQGTVSLYELPPAPPAESRFPPAYRGLQLSLRQFRYAVQQMADEIAYRWQTRGKRIPPVHNHPTRGHILFLHLPEDALESLGRRARREGVTLNSTLNAAMLLAVNRHLYAGRQVPMRTISFANLRPYVQPPLPDEELACYISMLRYTVTASGGADFWTLARELHTRIYSSFKSGDKFVAATMAESRMKMVTHSKSLRMGTTALNYHGMVPIQPSYGEIKVTGLHGFVSPFDLGPELAAQAQVFNNQLFWDFMYLEADMSREEADAILGEIENILNSAL